MKRRACSTLSPLAGSEYGRALRLDDEVAVDEEVLPAGREALERNCCWPVSDGPIAAV